MKHKNIPIIILGIIMILIIAFSILLIGIKISYSKEKSYQGYVSAYFYSSTDIEEIFNICKNENLTIEGIDNITIGNDKYIEVKLKAPTYEEGEAVADILEKYDIVIFTELYEDL